MITTLNIEQLKGLFKGGAANIRINREYVDSLNVFPVPDGDTGTNMSLTMVATINELDNTDSTDIKTVCQAFSRGALKGARGNSGVILSQIFKGMSRAFSDASVINTKVFAQALKLGSDDAYDAVTKPKEGTILTVIRMVSQYAIKMAKTKIDFLDFFKIILAKTKTVLDSTTEMLDELKKANVVDSGGMGLLFILTGMYNSLAGIEMIESASPEQRSTLVINKSQKDEFFPDVHNLDEIKFAYCTEFFIINIKKKVTTSDIDKLRDKLMKIGDCVIVVGDLSLVKVHVHTNNPDKALTYALELGELDKPKIENMLEQGRIFKKEAELRKNKPCGLISVCVGDGLKEIFTELNVDAIIEGGQTMNPSVNDIVNLANSVKADTVYILPNNSNIILAAEQAKELTVCELIIIPTKSVQQGIAAALNFNPEASITENITNMQSAASDIKSGMITTAVRDTISNGIQVKIDDIIGVTDEITAVGDDLDDVTIRTLEKMFSEDTASITLYYGVSVEDEMAAQLCGQLRLKYPYCDVEIYYGGQSHYFYLLAVE
ncbi:MAG: DAK2 domain-containing protein [Christensenellaceae bacterium]|jgi:DAK2 domain fusion protein YloV|nr:DAK2 domain-containing protein [Christensenellaceae bacterium]